MLFRPAFVVRPKARFSRIVARHPLPLAFRGQLGGLFAADEHRIAAFAQRDLLRHPQLLSGFVAFKLERHRVRMAIAMVGQFSCFVRAWRGSTHAQSRAKPAENASNRRHPTQRRGMFPSLPANAAFADAIVADEDGEPAEVDLAAVADRFEIPKRETIGNWRFRHWINISRATSR